MSPVLITLKNKFCPDFWNLPNPQFRYAYMVVQLAFIVVFVLMVKYDQDGDARDELHNSHPALWGPTANWKMISIKSNMFHNVHQMILIGFGFLMTFSTKYSCSSVRVNLMLAALLIQWAVICQGLYKIRGGYFPVGLISLLKADVAVMAVFISCGALIDICLVLQLFVMSLLEVAVFSLNEHLLHVLKVSDVGGSILVHVFGAYYGLATSCVLFRSNEKICAASTRTASSTVLSSFGTLYLWVYWPSFNGGLAAEDEQVRAIVNTYLSLSASTIVTFTIITHTNKEPYLTTAQNATLAGAVAVGAIANTVIHPYGALLIGTISGITSGLGYRYLTPLLSKIWGIHDAFGIHNLHGIPGVLSAVFSIIVSFIAEKEEYGYSLFQIYPARAPLETSSEFQEIKDDWPSLEPGYNRSAKLQAAYQLTGLCITLTLAILGGCLTGLLINLKIFKPPHGELFYDDCIMGEISENYDMNNVSETNELLNNNYNKCDK